MKQRIGAGIGTAAVVGLVAWALVLSLAYVNGAEATRDALAAITVMPLDTPPAPPVVPERRPSPEPEGEAAQPNVRSTPTQIVAPKTIILTPPPPVAVATVAGSGAETTAGAARLPGPGQGAGGIGDGLGSGGSGDGTGGGLQDETPPRRIRGELQFSDAVRFAGWENIIGRSMTTRFTVETDGRVSDCRIQRSSGLPELDSEICRLIVQRFRYRPSRDGLGRAVRAGVEMDHSWEQR